MMTSRAIRTDDRAKRPGLALFAVLWTVHLAASPAFAQRRRGEPEANPDFQDQVQGGAAPGGEQGGAPTDQGGGGFQPPPGAAEPVADPGAGGFGGRQVQGVQIGAGAAPPAPPPPSNPLETRVTVRVKDAPLATFLDTISAQAKVNFIITEGVTQRKVTAFLQNVTVREALQILLELKGLTYQQIGRSNTYIVGPRSQNAPNQITRIYVLNHVPLIPLLGAEDGVGAGAGGGGGGAAGGADAGGGGGGGGAGGGGGGGGARGGAPGGGKIAIINVINSLLSRTGRVSLDPRTNSVVVTDIPEIFPQVEQIIAELDKKVPQVMIEAQVVEINSERSNNLGISWTAGGGVVGSFTGGTRETSFPFNLPKNLVNTHFFDPTNSLYGGVKLNQSATPSVVNLSGLNVVLKAIVTRGEGRFLGKPKVLTLNNKKATIEITREETIGLKTEGSGANGQFTNETPITKNTGVKLEVTPQVNKEGYLTLLVEPSFTDVVNSAFTDQKGRTFKDPVVRKASTLLRLRNGQTIVLGGLLQSREQRTIQKVPFLGYIPLIGWLFTTIDTQRKNTDLVIFLTPSVVND